MEGVAASIEQLDPDQAAALRAIMDEGNPVKLQQAMDLILRLHSGQ